MLKICLTGSGYTENHLSKLTDKGFEVFHYEDPLTHEKLSAILPKFHAYVLGGDERLGAKELSVATNLRLISFVGTGYTSFIDEEAAAKQGIRICNTPSIMAPAVVEHTIGILIGLQRKLFHQNWQAKNSVASSVCSDELSSLSIGIIGLGEIGSRIAKILRNSFGSEVTYFSRTVKPKLEAALGIKAVSLDDIFSSSDVIILSLPTNSETEYFINDELLSKTKRGVKIVNTAGARLIEPVALKKYIDIDQVASVAFDGYYIEPLPSVSEDPFALLSLPDEKFIVTPHTAAKTNQSWSRMIDGAVDNIVNFY